MRGSLRCILSHFKLLDDKTTVLDVECNREGERGLKLSLYFLILGGVWLGCPVIRCGCVEWLRRPFRCILSHFVVLDDGSVV